MPQSLLLEVRLGRRVLVLRPFLGAVDGLVFEVDVFGVFDVGLQVLPDLLLRAEELLVLLKRFQVEDGPEAGWDHAFAVFAHGLNG